MKNMTRIIYYAIALALFLPSCGNSAPKAILTVEVVNDNGYPLAGATIKFGFETSRSDVDEIRFGTTDGNGRCTISGTAAGVIFYSATKAGYYDNIDNRYNFSESDGSRNLPSGPICRLVLKRVIEPLPMYVRRVVIDVPVLDTALGFDLQEADWVAPFGKGRTVDFIFKVTRKWKNITDFASSVQLSFARKTDGIKYIEGDVMHGSVLITPQLAPDSGYDSSWASETSTNPSTGRKGWGSSERANYIFRTRSVVDGNGNIVEANYGKIYGNIRYGGEARGKMQIAFWYYFNPKVNSRGLEFDTTRNLFRDVNIPKP